MMEQVNIESSVYLKSIPLVFADHGSRLLKALHEQQQKSQLCDVSLVVENMSFPAHKAVLAAHSSYFQALFEGGKHSDDAGSKACNVTTIHLSSITTNTFIPILHFLYTSRLHVFCENVHDLMRTARKLQISTIVQACEHLLAEGVTLPSVREVQKSSSSNHSVIADQPAQRVLYVDLKSEDDEEYQSVSDKEPIVDPLNEQRDKGTKMRRFFKKKGFPKKIEQDKGVSDTAVEPVQSVNNISTLSPTSIFGRNSQAGRSRVPTTSLLQSTTPSESLAKFISSNAFSTESSPFETNLESLGSIFGGDPSLIIDSFHTTDSPEGPQSMDKSKESIKTATPKSTDALQLPSITQGFIPVAAQVPPPPHISDMTSYVERSVMKVSSQRPSTLPVQSVFSMSPRITTAKSAPSDCLQRIGSSLPVPDTISSFSASIDQFIRSSSSSPSVTCSVDGTPSVYTCKDCSKYFTNVTDAIRHYYCAHQQPATDPMLISSKPASSDPRSHSCPNCGRLFNNKNNLKRHILIKHTTDKRFKCSVCGRRYAIRQSLQYHIRAVHGSDEQPDILTTRQEIIALSKNESLEQRKLPEVSSSSYDDTEKDHYPSTSSFLTTTPVAASLIERNSAGGDDEVGVSASDEIYLPTIERVESIHSVYKTDEKRREEVQAADSSDLSSTKVGSRTMTSGSSNHTARSSFADSSDVAVLAVSLEASRPTVQSLMTPQPLLSVEQEASAIMAGNPFVLAGTSNLPALLPALQAGFHRPIADLPPTVHSRAHPRFHHRCDTCARVFPTIHAYSRHRRSCNKHECPICHRGFSQVGNMKRHMKIFHSDQKPYECKMCNKAYGIQQSFRYHMRDKHGINATPKPKLTAGSAEDV